MNIDEDSGNVIDLDAMPDDPPAPSAPSTEDTSAGRARRLLAAVRRPWPRSLLVAATAVVSIAGMSLVGRPEAPQPQTAAPAPAAVAPTVAEEQPVFVYDAENGNWIMLGGSSDSGVGQPGPGFPQSIDRRVTEAVQALDTRPDVVLKNGTGMAGGETEIPFGAGDYAFDLACAADAETALDYVLRVKDGDVLAEDALPCGEGHRTVAFHLDEAAVLVFELPKPNGTEVGYAFWFGPAD